MSERHLLVGFGVTNRAVAAALVARGYDVVAADDAPTLDAIKAAAAIGVELLDAPDYELLVPTVVVLLPSPGLGDVHPAIDIARTHGIPVRSELDLAAEWDHRRLVAITGTDGKTTVTTSAADALTASGLVAAAVGNTEVPLVTTIDDPAIDVFVVEASSFRLGHSERFAPEVGTWLNVSPDHLDRHRTMADYVAAKARIWHDQSPGQWAVGNADDPVVADLLERAPAWHVTFGITDADYRMRDDDLVTPGGDVLAWRGDLFRDFPHDITNALAACATVLPVGATLEGCRDALARFKGLPHRISLVAERDGVRWYDDSKATTPNATLAAVRSFDSVVLVAGGRNKGADLGVLAGASGHVRAVVAIGEAAREVEQAFGGTRPVVVAGTMAEAVAAAAEAAQPGDVVLLSPACASFDWYGSYAERGDDFARLVIDLVGAS